MLGSETAGIHVFSFNKKKLPRSLQELLIFNNLWI